MITEQAADRYWGLVWLYRPDGIATDCWRCTRGKGVVCRPVFQCWTHEVTVRRLGRCVVKIKRGTHSPQHEIPAGALVPVVQALEATGRRYGLLPVI